MTSRASALAASIGSIGFVVAQYFLPTWTGFHTWQYAALLGIGAAIIVSYLVAVWRAGEVGLGPGLRIASFGALIVIVAGLASGLLGPDTETISRAPGTVAPLPDVGAAAAFPNVDAASLVHGDARVILWRRNGTSLEIAPGQRRFIGTTALETTPHVAVFIEARDSRGNHLTVTQPTNAAFLSPVLLFPQTVKIVGKDVPADGFVAPAVRRQIKAFYFSKEATADIRARGVLGEEAVLFSVDDEAGRPLRNGIGFDRGGEEIELGGIRLRATIGTYPALVISAIPSLTAVSIGTVLFLVGLAFAFISPLGFLRRAADKPHGNALAPTLIAAAFVAAALTSCTRLGTSGPGEARLHPWTRPDTVRIGLFEEPDSLNPVIGSMAFASDVYQLIFDGLIRYDDKGRRIPDLAREIPTLENGGISKDGKTLTYHLMPNVRWHDGVLLTAADVLFTWRQLMNPQNLTPTRNGYDRITAIDAPDPRTVRIHLRQTYPPALYLFRDLNQGAILPKHLLEGNANLNRVSFNSHPVGSGPYLFKGWQHGGGMTFEANPNYFRGKPKIAHVQMRFIHDQNTLLEGLRAHEIDVYYGVSPLQVDEVQNIPGIKVASTSTLHWEHLNFNTQRPPLDDVRVRRALCYAMDEATIFQKIYHGRGTVGPVHFNPDFEWADRSIKPYPYDPKAAAALLDEAGWKLGSDGFRYKNGEQLAVSISTVAGVKNREAIEVLLESWWRAVGMNLHVKNYPAATLFAPMGAGGMMYGGKTDVAIFTWQNVTPDPDDETYISPKRLPPIGQNVSFFKSDDIGRWQQAALATYDPAIRRGYYLKIQRVLIDQVPEYVMDWLPEVVAFNEDLDGVRPVPVGSDLWNIANWTIGIQK